MEKLVEQRYLTRPEQADYLTARGLKTSAKTLGKQATVGGGPEYFSLGKSGSFNTRPTRQAH